jgi:hypothetical protein
MINFIATQEHKTTTASKSMTLYEMYEYIRAHRVELASMKKQAANTRIELEHIVADMTYKIASVESAKKANRLRSALDEMIKNIRAIEACSKEIVSLEDQAKSKNSQKDIRKPFRECVENFVKLKGSEPFEPTEVARFVAESRNQPLTNSLRVFTHRIIKDFVLEKKIVQLAHGLYESSNAPTLFCEGSVIIDSAQITESSVDPKANCA